MSINERSRSAKVIQQDIPYPGVLESYREILLDLDSHSEAVPTEEVQTRIKEVERNIDNHRVAMEITGRKIPDRIVLSHTVQGSMPDIEYDVKTGRLLTIPIVRNKGRFGIHKLVRRDDCVTEIPKEEWMLDPVRVKSVAKGMLSALPIREAVRITRSFSD